MFFDPKTKDKIIRAVPAPTSAAPAERESRPRGPLERPWSFLRRHKGYPLAGLIAALLVAAAIELVLTPRYRATIQILIAPVDLRLVEKSVQPTAPAADSNVMQVETETRILTSDRVLRRVVRRERLTDDPEFQTRAGGARLDGLIDALRSAIGKPPEQAKTADRELDALRLLQRNISAKRTERTYVVDLTVESTDPEKAARIANAIGIAYLDEQASARAEAARRATESLSARLNEQRERVRQAEEQVELYKAQHNIVDAGGRLVDDQQLTELNNQLSAARARTAEAKARYDLVLQLRRGGLDQGATPEAIQSSTLGLLRDQYATIARQEANLAELGPRHPRVIEARAQLRQAQQQIDAEIARIADASRIDYERMLANETALTNNLTALKQRAVDTGLASVKLRELEREAEASRAVYESFLVRAREIREQEHLDTANVRILADAQPLLGRSWPPRRMLMLSALLMLGLFGGIVLAFGIELIRRPRAANIPAEPSAVSA